MKLTFLAGALAALLFAPPAAAEPTVEQYLASRGEDRTVLTAYIIGAQDALGWTNAALQERGDAPLFCVPERLALTRDQVVDIVDRFAAAKAEVLEEEVMYLSLFVMFAMQDAFPCSGQAS